MQKRDPVIIAPDYTDDELYEWMHQKIKAVQDLKWANEARAKQAENLSALEQDITNLEKAAALSIARMITPSVINFLVTFGGICLPMN